MVSSCNQPEITARNHKSQSATQEKINGTFRRRLESITHLEQNVGQLKTKQQEGTGASRHTSACAAYRPLRSTGDARAAQRAQDNAH